MTGHEGLQGGEREERLLGRGADLLAHLEERMATEGDVFADSDHRFTYAMTEILADRIKSGVVPMGFVMATELVKHDANAGVDGFTGEPMPRDVTGYPPILYGMYTIHADQLARGAFGNEFADGVQAFRDQVASAAQDPNNAQ